MIRFKKFAEYSDHFKIMNSFSVQVGNGVQQLYLRFDSKDKLIDISYSGEKNIYFEALCQVTKNLYLKELTGFGPKAFEKCFSHDESFWEIHEGHDELLFESHWEIFHAALNLYKGKESDYNGQSPLVCRCFNVREDAIISYFKKSESPHLEGLILETKASLGCRSCYAQLSRFFDKADPQSKTKIFKNKFPADWILEIDLMLECFPQAFDWQMEIKDFQDGMVTISYKKSVSQLEEERIGIELQRFLGSSVDEDLSFFLRRF